MIVENTLKRLYIGAKENKIKRMKYVGRINDYAVALEIEYTDDKTNKYSILSDQLWKLDTIQFEKAAKEIELTTGEICIRFEKRK